MILSPETVTVKYITLVKLLESSLRKDWKKKNQAARTPLENMTFTSITQGQEGMNYRMVKVEEGFWLKVSASITLNLEYVLWVLGSKRNPLLLCIK